MTSAYPIFNERLGAIGKANAIHAAAERSGYWDQEACEHITPDAIRRFWSKVEKSENCWLWTAGLDKDGYGQFAVNHHKNSRAHRIAFFLTNGFIAPLDMVLDHTCRNPKCVNPSHLEIVTNRINILRGNSMVAINARKPACPRGHVYDITNTRIYKGRRHCRACMPYHRAKYAERKKLGLVVERHP